MSKHVTHIPSSAHTFRVGAFYRRIALIFGLHLMGVATSIMLGVYTGAPLVSVLLLIAVISTLAWFAARHEWRPVSKLAEVISGWDEREPAIAMLETSRLSRRTDADVAALAQGLHGFATRISGFNQRERNFTRDASHELRSPLTVIRMSVDMLADETQLSDFGERSVLRIKRAAREMETLVEALLILAREADKGAGDEEFVVNDLLRKELEGARQMLEGRSLELVLEEPARFAVRASPRVFSVLCWQLIRNASQQTERGRIVITVLPDAITVTNWTETSPSAVDRHGFELAIARRISERFAWPLELSMHGMGEHVARVTFPEPLPA